MRKRYLFALSGLAVCLSLSACGNTTKETEAPAADAEAGTASEETEEEVYSIEYEEEETETYRPLDAITPSDYLIADVEDSFVPGELEGLSVTQYSYEVSDEMLEEQIELELEMYSEELEVNRAAEDGDVIYVELSYTVQGEEDAGTTTESTFFTIGDEEYGADFDAALSGAKAGDVLSFTITFGSDSGMTDWDDKTVEFSAAVTGVSEIHTPELDDDFVQEYTGYSTVEEFQTALREAMEEEYASISLSDAYASLIDVALEGCVISSVPDELLQSCREELVEEYGAFFGTTDETELLDLTGMTSDDLDAEAVATAERRLLISYICEENQLTVTEEDYVAYVEQAAEDYGYASAYDLEQDFTRTSLVWMLYEDKAAEWLYQSAEVAMVSYEESLLDEDETWAEDLEEDTEEGVGTAIEDAPSEMDLTETTTE